jgi:alpha-galactosidase
MLSVFRSIVCLGVTGWLLLWPASRVLAQDPAILCGKDAPANAIWLDSLDLSKVDQGWGVPRAGRSVDNHPLQLHGKEFFHGLGTHAESEMRIDLKGAATQFVAMVGVDDEVGKKGTVGFEVWVDGKQVANTGVMRGGHEPKLLSVDLQGAKELLLLVNGAQDGIEYDHADWAGALLSLAPGATARPETTQPPAPPAPALVPETSPLPAIHSPTITGSTPGRPFLFLIPATGEKPLHFSAADLPAGLTLDETTGIITGSLRQAGTSVVQITAKNARGETRGNLTIVGGQHQLALTPPMGWNSWNCWASSVSDEKVRAAADAMVASGLAAHGFQFVNIDDCWEGQRDGKGEIQTNKKFPDMKALADYVHSRGLKLGIYSSPGPKTCAGYEASWQHEQQDANTYAKWGVDYLKYDWCSYGGIAPHPDLEGMKKPYRVMREALDNCDRDIVFSLCQYGMGQVWQWGAQVGGNCWRTTGDINDSWSSMSGIGFGQDGHEQFAGPGHWNDPDMLVVGKVGWGPSLHPTHLKPYEQITHITLWCLLSSPLLIGCDMSAMDDFTIALLTNSEVLAISQDPLGKPAGRLKQDGKSEVWARPLSDGTLAVGLFNRGIAEATIRVDWADLKLDGTQGIRDLWEHKDLGSFPGGFAASVPMHGAVLLKIGNPKTR